MGTSRKWNSAWICLMLFLLVVLAGLPDLKASREAVPAAGRGLAQAAFPDLHRQSFNLDRYILAFQDRSFNALDEEKKILTEKKYMRQLRTHHQSRYQYLLASRSIHLMRYAEWEKERLGQKVASNAQRFLGTPYVWGGTSPNGFDCSGFAQYVMKSSGVKVPRNSYEQFEVGQPVAKESLKPGDLVFFSTYAPGPSHLGIYIGNGRFVHALNRTTGVTVSTLDADYYKARFIGAKRVL